MKVSLHESGDWRLQLTSSFVDEQISLGNWHNQTRQIESWEKPEQIGAGIILAARIIIPASELRQFPIEISDSKPVVYVKPPIHSFLTEFNVCLSTPSAVVPGWPGKRSMSTELVGSGSLPSGDTLWVTSRSYLPNEKFVERISAMKSKIQSALPSEVDIQGPGIRILASGREPDGSYALVELAFDSVT